MTVFLRRNKCRKWSVWLDVKRISWKEVIPNNSQFRSKWKEVKGRAISVSRSNLYGFLNVSVTFVLNENHRVIFVSSFFSFVIVYFIENFWKENRYILFIQFLSEGYYFENTYSYLRIKIRNKNKKDFEKEFYNREYSKIIFSKRKIFNFLLL